MLAIELYAEAFEAARMRSTGWKVSPATYGA
jgi:hypothetical protein